MSTASNKLSPHANQPIVTAGPDPLKAVATLILLHGRGAQAEDMIGLYEELDVKNIAAIAPQAANNSWYPHSFLAPLKANQPYLDSALDRIQSIVIDLIGKGVSSEKIAFLGFSQGACLTSEFVARHPRAYGGVMALTGGLIGPPGTPRNYPASLAGTPVFLGTSDPDPHVPLERVKETKSVFETMGAKVDLRRYPGLPHTINREELDVCRDMLLKLEGVAT